MSAQDVFLDFRQLRALLGAAPLGSDQRAAIFDTVKRIEGTCAALERDRNEWRVACAVLGKKLAGTSPGDDRDPNATPKEK